MGRYISESRMDIYEKKLGISLKGIKIKSERKLKVIRNCVEPKARLYILNCAMNKAQKTL